MTMNAMVEYLEKKGFKAEKDYSKCEKKYKFTISKNGKEASAFYKYSPYVPAYEVNALQKQFLDDLIKQWYDWFGEDTIFETRKDSELVLDELSFYNYPAWERFRKLILNSTYGKNGWYEIKTNNPHGNYETQLKMYAELYDKEFNMKKHRNILTVKEVFDTLTSQQKIAVYAIVGEAIKTNTNETIKIKDVIFSPPATIVFWKDGTKTVVKAEGEDYDPEKGLAMAISKKVLGNNYSYYNTFKKWLKKAPTKND